MTSYAYTARLGDGDMVALESAVKPYMDRCRSEIANGNRCPYWAHLQSLERVMKEFQGSAALSGQYIPG